MTTITRCRIASDVDQLSRLQLEEVSRELKHHHPKLTVELVAAEVDHSQNGSSPNSPARVAFLMNQLLEGDFDALVLNAIQLSARLPSGLTIGAITNRLTPYDVLISADCLLDELDQNATLIANDIRIESQLLFYRPDLTTTRSKGSVDALIQKVHSGKADAVVLAAGDVERLNKQDHVVEFLTCSVSIPAAGQGSLAVLVRSDEEHPKKSMRAINDPAAYAEIAAERAFLDYLGVSEEAPVGVLGSIEGKTLELEGMIAFPDGRERIREVVTGSVGKECELGEQLAREILDVGGRAMLQELNLP